MRRLALPRVVSFVLAYFASGISAIPAIAASSWQSRPLSELAGLGSGDFHSLCIAVKL